MKCCNHDCNEGRNCPARQACELPEDDGKDDWFGIALQAAAVLVTVVFFLMIVAGSVQ